ncbi:MAG TPA: hypothetical protein VGK59_10975 [Ohtaekwangia sp.]
MKKIVIIILLAANHYCFSQEQKQSELSNADKFSAKSGTLIERQFIDIGVVKSIEVKVLKLKDLNDNSSFSALRFEYEYKGGSTYSNDTKVASLDSDEIDGLIKSIKNLQTNVFPSTRTVYTEVTYRSRAGFEAGTFFDVSKGKWSTYLQLEKYDNKSMVFLTAEDFSPLLALIEQAKAKM